jgi:hypothetical protein
MLNKIFAFTSVSLGIFLLIVSMFYVSSFAAIVGVALGFWGAIFLYIMPTKNVPLSLLNASVDGYASNIERILNEYKLQEKGFYLPPKSLKNMESSLIFIPNSPETKLPSPDETSEKLYGKQKNGIFITPPGLMLSRLFEQELSESFLETNLDRLQNILPKLFIEKLELAESFEMHMQENTITVKLRNSIFNRVCLDTDNQPLTHSQVGCVLSSSLACAFAKAAGKFIIIQNETKNPETKTTTITYHIGEE